jgi:hypothetical protein
MAASLQWYRRKLVWALITVPSIGVVLLLSVDSIAAWYLRHKLAAIERYQITFDHAHLRPLHADLEVTRFKVVDDQAGGGAAPLLYMNRFDFGVHWKELLHGHVVATLRVDGAKVHLIAAKSKEESQLQEVPEVAVRLEKISPLRFDRIQVKNGELTFIDRTVGEAPRVWLHDFDATAENLATRAELARGQPTVIAAAGKIGKGGEISAYVTADPLAQGLWFAGEAHAIGLDVRDFHQLITSRAGLALDRGTLDVFAKFFCNDSHISGGVKPILKDPHVIQVRSGVDNWFKTSMADAGLKIFANDTEQSDGTPQVATTVPIDGYVTDPKPQLWPTVFGVVRNAFVEGVTESYARLPPPTAPRDESLIKQGIDALDKGKNAPKLQPQDENKS